MSSFIIGGGRTYSLDLDIVKSPSTSSRTSQTSSPSSTLSESSNSPLAISTRKPRTPRKRPNQTYNEAAALLSTAYPNVFPTKILTKPHKFTSPHDNFFDESSELLLPFRVISDDGSGFLLPNHQPTQEKPNFLIEPSKVVNSCSGEVDSCVSSANFCSEFNEDFDAESILDEEIEEGIDSIMGNLSVDNEKVDASSGAAWHGNPIGLGFGGKFEFPLRGVRAWRHSDEVNWWNFPTVDVRQISPKITNNGKVEKKKKKRVVDIKDPELPKENPIQNPKPNAGLNLKLNYNEVLNAWSDRGCPFTDDADAPGSDVSARLAQIDLFSDGGGGGGGVREASVLRYKEKRRTRLFSKKIRYQVRKVNADRRPRMKGRFVRRPNSSGSDES
ncbi:hypothetical protein SLEP1_g13018 [Rubroshorea leprosula]|uniref:CCT domain-containing protein n=1 Tax=Rubroshorea leprosula TaxID=152421 RepID=A0AAV5IK68_9ROSI|nr:hypothetical protein SLEP1_g13018 [Rubroshorea leprosula]